uniref:hypothetical protein n=1 Tax=Wolbachia pipientis TaxID=955 RepID=UPI0038B63006
MPIGKVVIKSKKFLLQDEIALDHHTIKDVRVFTGQTTYQPSIDYIVDSSSVALLKRTENSCYYSR